MSNLKELEEMFFQGKLTRREFITRVSALGFSLGPVGKKAAENSLNFNLSLINPDT